MSQKVIEKTDDVRGCFVKSCNEIREALYDTIVANPRIIYHTHTQINTHEARIKESISWDKSREEVWILPS